MTHIEYDLKCFCAFIKKWTELPIDFSFYGFIPPSQSGEFWGPNLINLKAGDYNLNGFVDLMAVMRNRG